MNNTILDTNPIEHLLEIQKLISQNPFPINEFYPYALALHSLGATKLQEVKDVFTLVGQEGDICFAILDELERADLEENKEKVIALLKLSYLIGGKLKEVLEEKPADEEQSLLQYCTQKYHCQDELVVFQKQLQEKSTPPTPSAPTAIPLEKINEIRSQLQKLPQ